MILHKSIDIVCDVCYILLVHIFYVCIILTGGTIMDFLSKLFEFVISIVATFENIDWEANVVFDIIRNAFGWAK